jgi:hypothetical protein
MCASRTIDYKKSAIPLFVLSLGLFALPVLFAVEVDTGYYWSGSYLISEGLIPYKDFFSFQYPPIGIYIYSPLIRLFNDLIIQRIVVLILLLFSVIIILKFQKKNNSDYKWIILAYVCFLSASHDVVGRLIQLDMSKQAFSTILMIGFSFIATNSFMSEKYKTYLSSLTLIVFSSLKLLNGPLALVFLLFLIVVFRKKSLIWLFLVMLIFVIFEFIYLFSNDLVVFQSYEIIRKNYDLNYGGRVSLRNLYIIGMLVLEYIAPIVLLFIILNKKNIIIGKDKYRVLLLEDYGFVVTLFLFAVVYVVTYLFIPPKTWHAYILPAIPVLYVSLSYLLISVISDLRERLKYISIFMSILFFVSSFMATRIPLTDTHPINYLKGGLYQNLAFKGIAKFIRENKASLNKNNDKKYLALRWPQPIIIAQEKLSSDVVMGNNRLNLEYMYGVDNVQKDFYVSDIEMGKNHVLNIKMLIKLLEDNSTAGIVLDTQEYSMIVALMHNYASYLSLKKLIMINEIGLYKVESVRKIFSP